MAALPYAVTVALSDEDRTRYYVALGRMMHMFSRAEDSLNYDLRALTSRLLRKQADDCPFSLYMPSFRMKPVRVEIAKVLSRRRARPETLDAFAAISQQIGQIQWVRDFIAHYGSSPYYRQGRGRDLELWIFSLKFNQLRPDQEENIWLPVQTLFDMSDDLYEATALVNRLLAGSVRPTELIQRLSWRYKPQQLVRSGRKHQRKTPPL